MANSLSFAGLSRMARLAALTLVAGGAGLTLQAEQPTPLNLNAALKTPADLYYSTSTDASSSSSSVSPVDPGTFTLGEGMQPPPRRRYGRPRYTDKSHNADGSNKLMFELGGGFTLPVGGTNSYAKPNFNFQGGVGRNFNQHAGVILQFDYARFGITTSALNTLLTEYNREIDVYNQTATTTISDFTQLGGGTHTWSFSLNPIYNFNTADQTYGAYVVGGVGFYHRYTNFTTPTTGTGYDYYYGAYTYTANQTIDSYVSNSVGANAGFGFTYKPSRFANERLFAEARYVFTDNSPRPYYNGVTGTSLSSTYFNVFPQASAKTTFIPVTIGVRF